MITSDILNIILAIGVLVIVSCIAVVSFFLVQTLKVIRRVAENLENSATDLSFLKEKLKVGAMGVATSVLANILSRLINKKRG